MGFSLSFFPIENGDLGDADRDGLAAFLAAQGLRVDPNGNGLLFANGEPLSFDGSWSDLTLDPLDQPEPVTGALSHATLTESECAFVFDLCAAGKLMIVNPQGNPTYIALADVHSREASPDPDDSVWVRSATELALALEGGFGRFQDYLQRVRSGSSDGSEDQ